MPAPDEEICGRIRILREGAEGVGCPLFGPALVAQDDESGAELLLTIVGEAYLPGMMAMSSFMAGANPLTRLRHPGLVRVAVVDREQTYAVIGYEALPGGKSLRAAHAKRATPATIIRRSLELARALDFLHERNTFHGLVSASTVLVWEQSAMLWQYGLLPLCDPEAIRSGIKRLAGTTVFAPELQRGGEASPATDVWGWAAVIAQLASGDDGLEAVAGVLGGDRGSYVVDARTFDLLATCLAGDPRARPQDGRDLLVELEHIGATMEGSGVTTLGGTPVPVAASGTPRLPWAVPTTGAAAPPPPPPLPPPPPPSPLTPPFAAATDPAASAADWFDADPSASDSAMSLTEDDLVPATDERPAPAARSARSTVRPVRVGEPTANLKVLAQSQVGDDFVAGLERVLEGSPETSYLAEPGLVDLAQDAAPDLLPAIPDLHAGASSALAGGASSERRHPLGDDRLAGAPALAVPVGVGKFELPRRPGPHGPSSTLMSRLLGVGAGLIVLLALAHTLAQRSPRPTPPAPPAGVGAGQTEAEGDGEAAGSTEMVIDDDSRRADLAVELPPPVKECPEGTVAVDASVCIDSAEYPGLRRMPITGVTVRQAATACEQREGRLCALAEWQRACKGGEARSYPYGPTIRRDACNTASIAGFPQEVGTSGSWPECATPEGVFDLLGNVGEWVAEGIAVGGDSSTPPRQTTCNSTGRPPKGFAGPDLGFRCCYDR